MRRAGTGILARGGRVTWTVADGGRGRRWRAMLVDDDQVAGVLLAETGPDGRLGRLELASAAGLLTLHPEGTTLHGNIVRPEGVDHVTLPWGEDHVLHVLGTPATAAIAAQVLRRRLGVGEGRSVPGVLVSRGVEVRPVTFRVARIGPRGWHFVTADTGDETAITLDLDGVPVLAAGETWPLELAHHD